MNQALLTTAAAMRARLESLEVLGNNMANASTNGYKADQEFYALFLTAQARTDPRTGDAGWMPVAEGSAIDFRQGPLQPTGSPLDLALEGDGFLAVRGPQGQPYFTRAGSLRLDADGGLRTAEGFAVLDTAGEPVKLPRHGEIEIAEGGVIAVDGTPVARISLVEFENRALLRKQGLNVFMAPEGLESHPAAATAARQGAVEGSNVSTPEGLVRLINATRHFEMLRRVSTLIGEEMDGRAVETLGRSGA